PDAEQAQLRAGTDPVWVGEADAVQVAVPQDVAVEDMSLSLVSSPEGSATTAPAGVRGASVGATLASAGGAPRVVSRAQWGAAPLICEPDVATKLVGAVVHHTAGSNAYATQAQAMQQLRNDQR